MLTLPTDKQDSSFWARRDALNESVLKDQNLTTIGWYSVGGDSMVKYVTYACMVAEKITKHLGRPCRVLDLGSGNGIASFCFAKSGCEVLGIELDRGRFVASINNLEILKRNSRIDEDSKVRFIQGNFFPNNFNVRRNEDLSDVFSAQLPKLPRLKNNLHPSEYQRTDLFYHYQVESVQNLLNFFVQYARPGALLYICQHGSSSNYNYLPRGIKYLNPGGSFFGGHLYQKLV